MLARYSLWLRDVSKHVYKRVRYAIHGARSSRIALAPGVTLWHPTRWAGTGEGESGELFFGYFDKTPWSPDMNRLLYHSPTQDERVHLVVFSRERASREILATSSAWNWQQGAMVQWLPGSDGNELVFNDFDGTNLIAKRVGLEGEVVCTYDLPVQVIHPSGGEALGLNYARLDVLRADYGYGVEARNLHANLPYDQDGIWHLDLSSGNISLAITIQALIQEKSREDMRGAQHKVNHFLYAPDGGRFVFMHRWVRSGRRYSRLYATTSDFSDIVLLLDDDMVSHYAWKDSGHVVAWARTHEHGDHYYLIDVTTGERDIVAPGKLDVLGDGHPSYSPDSRWIVTDTYPDSARMRHLLLYDTDSSRVSEIGRFFAPFQYSGTERCDLHPRWSPDGKWISIDSAHTGSRQSYVLNIEQLVGER